MSAILPGIALVNNFDPNGDLMRGALLDLYQAGTTTPVIAYKDSGLTAGQEHPSPIPADSAARLPMFYLPDGAYRARLKTSDGSYVAYDVPYIEAVSPSGSGGGGGGGGGVSPEAIKQTGDLIVRLGSGQLPGAVRLNGRTIGNVSSGATERANNDCQNLFEYLYTEFSDTICPVIGGRGSSATADFNAGKKLTLIDGKGCALFGADGMGTTRAYRLTSASFTNADQVGTRGGIETHTLIRAELPAFKPGITITDPGHPHVDTGSGSISAEAGSGSGIDVLRTVGTHLTDSAVTGITAAITENLGSGQSFSMVPPGLIVTFYVKL